MKQKSNGVTLVELMIVILIIGVMTLIAAPLIANFGANARLRNASSTVISYLRLARTHAMTQNMRHAAVIYTRTASDVNLRNRIFIVKEENGVDIIVEKPWSLPSIVEIPDISGNDDFKRIEFTWRGTTGNSGSVHVIQKGTKISGSPYSPSDSYTSTAKSFYRERYKCHTITVTGSGRVRRYPYGKNTPWASNEIDT